MSIGTELESARLIAHANDDLSKNIFHRNNPMEIDPWGGVLTIEVMIFAAIAAKSLDDQDEEKKDK